MEWTRIKRVKRFTTDDEFDEAIAMLQASKYASPFYKFKKLRKKDEWWRLICDVRFDVGEQLIYMVGESEEPIPDIYGKLLKSITENLRTIQKGRKW